MSTVGLYLIGHGATDLYQIALKSPSALFSSVGRALYWVLPQLDRLDFKLQAAHEAPIDWSQLGQSAAYGVAYSVVLLLAAVTAFERTDFK